MQIKALIDCSKIPIVPWAKFLAVSATVNVPTSNYEMLKEQRGLSFSFHPPILWAGSFTVSTSLPVRKPGDENQDSGFSATHSIEPYISASLSGASQMAQDRNQRDATDCNNGKICPGNWGRVWGRKCNNAFTQTWVRSHFLCKFRLECYCNHYPCWILYSGKSIEISPAAAGII